MKAPLLGVFLLLPAPLLAQASPWLTDFEKAKAVAKEKKRPILAYFDGSDWQAYCQKMNKEVFEQQEFLDWAASNVVLLQIDTVKDKPLDEATKKQTIDLKAYYKVTTLPQVAILDPDGQLKGHKIIGLVTGGPAKFIYEVKKRLTDRDGFLPDSRPSDSQPASAAQKPAPGADKKDGAQKPAGPRAGWVQSVAEALTKAKKDKKVVLAAFTDDAKQSAALIDEVFLKDAFTKWAEKNVILLELDPKKEEKLVKDWKIGALPAVAFLDASGKKLGQLGYEKGGPEAWTKLADKIVKKK